MGQKVYSILNDFTVGQFLDTYPENVQDIISNMGYCVEDGHVYIDEESLGIGGNHGQTEEI